MHDDDDPANPPPPGSCSSKPRRGDALLDAVLDQANDWSGRRVLITGGAGFLGSSLAVHLVGLGARVTAVDNFELGGGANLENLAAVDVALVRADLRVADLKPICDGVDVMFNLAAQTGHLQGQSRPHDDLQINAAVQVRLFMALRQASPSARVVHASTRQVYGRSHGGPIAEDHRLDPPDFNAIAKLAGEQYWRLEHRLTGRHVVVLRLTNCYGPRQRIRDAEQSFLGYWIGCALNGVTFPVFGGGQVRDFCHADDAVAALVAAAETPSCCGGVFNVGGHSALTLLHVARVLGEETGAAFELRDMPEGQAKIDIGSYTADDRAFRRISGWRPRVPFEPGLAQTLAWFRPRATAYL